MTKEKMKMTYEIKDALSLIEGSMVNDSVVYYDDAMAKYYVGPALDLGYLVDLMNNPHTESAAYSHWCAGTYHGDGYDLEKEAIEAAK
jgi:hypothetical protein